MYSKWLKFIGWMQLVGGILGVVFISLYILQVVEVPFPFPLGYFIIAPALFCLSAIAGVMILKGHHLALTFSIVVQALQVVQIISPSFTYKFTANLDLIFFISSSSIRVSPGFHIDYWLGSSPFNEPSGMAINFAAAGILLYLINMHRKPKSSAHDTISAVSKPKDKEE